MCPFVIVDMAPFQLWNKLGNVSPSPTPSFIEVYKRCNETHPSFPFSWHSLPTCWFLHSPWLHLSVSYSHLFFIPAFQSSFFHPPSFLSSYWSQSFLRVKCFVLSLFSWLIVWPFHCLWNYHTQLTCPPFLGAPLSTLFFFPLFHDFKSFCFKKSLRIFSPPPFSPFYVFSENQYVFSAEPSPYRNLTFVPSKRVGA